MSEFPKTAIIGPGRLGQRLALALARSGWPIVAVRGRRQRVWPEGLEAAWKSAGLPAVDTWDSPRSAIEGAELIILSVSDDSIADVAERHCRDFAEARVVVHCSGSQSSAVLEACRQHSLAVGSAHPLQTFPSWPAQTDFAGVWMAVEGDVEAIEICERLAKSLGARPWRIESASKPRYHLGASLAANLAHVLVCEGRAEMAAAGLGDDAGRALAPLVRASLEAALVADGMEALTGPISRGDQGTISQHIGLLDSAVAEVYETLVRLVKARAEKSAGNCVPPHSGSV